MDTQVKCARIGRDDRENENKISTTGLLENLDTKGTRATSHRTVLVFTVEQSETVIYLFKFKLSPLLRRDPLGCC